MKRFLKIVGITIIVLVILISTALLYYFRKQEIDIGLIPNEFTYCGKQIHGNDKNYREIVSWLKDNKDGWVPSFASYVPNQVYRGNSFNINVLSDAVVVSYKTDYGFPQYIKGVEHGLKLKCK